MSQVTGLAASGGTTAPKSSKIAFTPRETTVSNDRNGADDEDNTDKDNENERGTQSDDYSRDDKDSENYVKRGRHSLALWEV